jgi:hypothetical protein
VDTIGILWSPKETAPSQQPLPQQNILVREVVLVREVGEGASPVALRAQQDSPANSSSTATAAVQRSLFIAICIPARRLLL